MTKKIKSLWIKRREPILLAIVLIYALIIRLWKLDTIPSVINGDESGSIIHPLQILFGYTKNLFNLTHDGNISYIVYLPKAWFINLLSISNTLLAVRITTAVFSLFILIPFYLIITKHVSKHVSLLITLAFATNYWYLNFSRLSWICIDSILFGLALLLYVPKMTRGKKLTNFVVGGVLSSLVLYNYMGGRIYFVTTIVALFVWVFNKRDKKIFLKRLKYLAVYLATTAILFLPQLTVIVKNKSRYLERPKSVFVFNQKNYYGLNPIQKKEIFFHQIKYSIKGFFVFDPSVSAEGIENQRYIPNNSTAINNLIKLLFWTGLIISILKKRGDWKWWSIYILNILVLQIPSVSIPSWSRAIGVIPIIYFFAALSLDQLNSLLIAKKAVVLRALLILAILLASFADVSKYWKWVNSREFFIAQQPAINISEFKDWQKYQIEWIKAGKFPFTFYEWQDCTWRKRNLRN